MAHMRLRDLQASATATGASTRSAPVQPTVTIALSTTFTPPASCVMNSLTILPPPGYFIWANEPVPFKDTTVTNCYPSEFLMSYTSVSSGTVGSSVVPAMSPLVCPQNFCIQFAVDDYIACCPSGYKFAAPENPVIASRPAYGGTCYSDFSVGVTATAVAYNGDGSTRLQPWAAETSGAQAYAHPIDGFAKNKPSVGCIAAVSTSLGTSFSSTIPSTSSATIPSSTATPPAQSSRIPGGTIAGAVLGALVGLAAILCLILFFLRRRHRHQHQSGTPEIHQIGDDAVGSRYEKDGLITATEIDAGVAPAELTAHSGRGAYELNAGAEYEMPANR